jgi:hypothetical protein
VSDAARPTGGLDGAQLVCPECARSYPRSERFCSACGMPLVYAAAAHGAQRQTTERQRKARKIKPQYSEGALVKVARVANQVEAEFIAALLLEEGIPCLLRSAIAGYAPVTGWRDVLVPESGAEAARETLAWERP